MGDAGDRFLGLGKHVDCVGGGVDDGRTGDADLDSNVGRNDVRLGDGGEGGGAGEMVVGVEQVEEVVLPEKLAEA